MSKVKFDMPHALVTLTTIDGNVEIEVWPKAGQSAFVVVSPKVAQTIADALRGMSEELTDLDDAPGEMPANVVDFASRRKPH
ncbi:MAG: hypothetical protein LH650_00410 [Chloroflexi bacterium]|nr:hypothetical protein [Chloroflexota bacterium]